MSTGSKMPIMTRNDMIEKHKELHQSLDELVCCFIETTHKLPSLTNLMEFMKWASDMTKNPNCSESTKEIPK